jgi:hypothetical protein
MSTSADRVSAAISATANRTVHPAEGREPLSTCEHCGAQTITSALAVSGWQQFQGGRVTCGKNCAYLYNCNAPAQGLPKLEPMVAPAPGPPKASAVRIRGGIPTLSQDGLRMGVTPVEERSLPFQCGGCAAKQDVHQRRPQGSKWFEPSPERFLEIQGWLCRGDSWFCGRLCADLVASRSARPPLPAVMEVPDASYQRQRAASVAQQQAITPAGWVRPPLASLDPPAAPQPPKPRGRAH